MARSRSRAGRKRSRKTSTLRPKKSYAKSVRRRKVSKARKAGRKGGGGNKGLKAASNAWRKLSKSQKDRLDWIDFARDYMLKGNKRPAKQRGGSCYGGGNDSDSDSDDYYSDSD